MSFPPNKIRSKSNSNGPLLRSGYDIHVPGHSNVTAQSRRIAGITRQDLRTPGVTSAKIGSIRSRVRVSGKVQRSSTGYPPWIMRRSEHPGRPGEQSGNKIAAYLLRVGQKVTEKVNVPAVVLGKRGSVPQVRTEAQRVFVDIFPIASYPLVPIEETRMRRYNVLDRVQVKARADLAEEEDACIFGTPEGSRTSEYSVATDSSLTTEANTVYTSTEGVTRDFVVKMMSEILQHDLLPEALIVHPRQYVDFFTWGRDEFDPETQREVLQSGRVGKLWGIEIFMSKICPSGTCYMRTSDEYFGVLPVLIDLDKTFVPIRSNSGVQTWLYAEKPFRAFATETVTMQRIRQSAGKSANADPSETIRREPHWGYEIVRAAARVAEQRRNDAVAWIPGSNNTDDGRTGTEGPCVWLCLLRVKFLAPLTGDSKMKTGRIARNSRRDNSQPSVESKAKVPGSAKVQRLTKDSEELSRRRLPQHPASHADEEIVRPAWQHAELRRNDVAFSYKAIVTKCYRHGHYERIRG